MKPFAFSFVVILTASGCTKIGPCKSGTLLVAITLAGASANADQLVVSVSVDNGPPRINPPQPHTPGIATGTLEVDFSSYPQGKSVTVAVQTLLDGAPIDEQRSAPLTLLPGCTSTSLTIGAEASTDLSLTSSVSDLGQASGDLGNSGPADMVCVPKKEDCFNGIDDDCNGLVDCADTAACSAIATCVAAVAGAGYATTTPDGTCPQASATPSTLYNSFTNVGNCTGCTSTVSGTPSLIVYSDSTVSCGTTSNKQVGPGPLTGSACTPVPLSSAVTFGTVTGLSCSPPTGTPQPAGGFASQAYCALAAGGGCTAGNVCVPKLPNANYQQCALIDSGTSCASTPYATGRGTWWTDKIDDRTCATCTSASTQAYVTVSQQLGSCSNPTGTNGISNAFSNSIVNTCVSAGIFNLYLNQAGDATGCHAFPAITSGSVRGGGSPKNLCCR
jgi:hypothetical protein